VREIENWAELIFKENYENKGINMTHVITEHPYFGVFVLFALTAVAFPATLWAARFVSRKFARLDTERLKLSIYECGPEVTKQPTPFLHSFT